MPKNEIKPDDIEWEMDWGDKPNSRGVSGKQMIFEEEAALAHLLINEVVFLNSFWWKNKDDPRADGNWTKEESEFISVNVNCNDVFAWGCADAESLQYNEIENLYRMWVKDSAWGPAIWCMIKRNQMPQKPVEKIIREAGIWDLDKLQLGNNTQDAEVTAYIASVTGRTKE